MNMLKVLIISGVFVCGMCVESANSAETLTFEEISIPENFSGIPNGYGGFNWDQWGWWDVSYDPPVSFYPYKKAVVSGTTVARGGDDESANFISTCDDNFNFIGAWFTSSSGSNVVTANGYNDGVFVDSASININSNNPTWFDANLKEIDRVEFVLKNKLEFSMDDFKFNKIIPSPPEPKPEGKIYGLFIGVDNLQYESSHGSLDPLTGSRGASIAMNSISKLPNYSNNSILLTGSGIVDADIEGALQQLKGQMNENDKFVMYFGGHGHYTDTGTEPSPYTSSDEYAFMADPNTHSYDHFTNNEFTLFDDELTAMIDNYMGDKEKWIFMDTCHSGGFWTDDMENLSDISFISSSKEDAISFTHKYLYDNIDNKPIDEISAGETVSYFSIAISEAVDEILNIDTPIAFGTLSSIIQQKYKIYGESLVGRSLTTSDYFGSSIVTPDMFEIFSAHSSDFNGTLYSAPVPEPGTTLLFGLGAATLTAMSRRRRKQSFSGKSKF